MKCKKAGLPITRACKLLGVPKSSVYSAHKKTESSHSLADAKLSKTIVAVFEESRRSYGKRRIQAELKHSGICVSLERISRLMKKSGLIALNKAHLKRKKHVLSKPEIPVQTDLVKRDFKPKIPNKVWVQDISYIKTIEGWLYLAVVIDLFSRKVVGWKASDNQKSELPIGALMVASGRRPEATEVILHSDRGSQYRSEKYLRTAHDYGYKASMGAVGTCYDNAACETFFATLKNELIYRTKLSTKEETTQCIFNYIERFYNPKRLHSTLGFLSPMNYEKLYG